MTDSKNILYLYDLPKENITSVTIAQKIKDVTKYDIQDQPQIKRDMNKPFYTAMVRINDSEKFKEVAHAMKYFDINGKPCRALPYMKEVTAAQRGNMNKNNNLFIKGLPKELTSQTLDEKFKEVLGGDFVQSAKVSINPDYSSRGYGFVCLDTPEHASQALAKSSEFNFEVHPYQPKDRRDLRKGFNNIYIKNFPDSWDDAKLKSVFEKYGTIKSLAVMRTKIPGKDEEAPFAFVCFEDPSDKEYGPKCALNAVQNENDKEYEGNKLYVKEALPKQQRELEKKREQNRFKNSKKRCNLYVKNFPENTTEEQLKAYFEKYGEIESIKLHHKEGAAVYAFVCYKNPESATYAKQQSASQTLNGKQLFLNFYEQKEIRKIQQEDARDRTDFQNFRKQSPAALNIDMLNRPETFQLLQYLMMTLQRQQQNQRPQFNNQQRPMRQGGQRGQYNQGGNFQQRQQPAPGQMPPQQMPPQPQQMRAPQQQPPMMMQAPPMGGQVPPNVVPVQNLPPHIAAYNQGGVKVSFLVNPANPTYKNQVGEFIYEYVEQIAGDEFAPKITGMLIDLPIPEIVGYVTDYFKLQGKVNEALTLLKSQQ